ncbi:hypothetical protein [Nocardia gamkensis]|uniref:hypothetical protein n=1 Tax=Nocardia gamkensis TaxID=352869 RepID=UPI0037C77D8F
MIETRAVGGCAETRGWKLVRLLVIGRDGTMSWKAAAAIERWRFDPGATGPAKSWRSASLCDDGNPT